MNTKTKSLKLQICDRILNEAGEQGALTRKETPQQKAAREKAAAEKKSKEKATVTKVNTNDEGTNVTELVHMYDIATWTAIAVGSLILLRIAGRAVSKKITDVAERNDISKINAVGKIINNWASDKLAGRAAQATGLDALIKGIEGLGKKLTDDLEKTKSEIDMIKKNGLTRAEARAIIDEIGTIEWNTLAKQLEAQSRIEYYAGKIELDDYILAAGYAGNPRSKKIAETWMPIIKKAYTGQMKFVKLNTINNTEKFKTWFDSALGWTEKYWKDMPELKDMPNDYRIALKTKPDSMWYEYYQAKKPKAINYVADRINQIIKNTTLISEDILNIANTTNSFPAYKKWSAIQTVTRRPTDVNTFLRQKFCWYAQKHSI